VNGDEPATAAERALDQHLESVRSSPPPTDASLRQSVVRTARWQRAVRAPLRVAAMIAAASASGAQILVGRRRG
jgi:hypothetical protein